MIGATVADNLFQTRDCVGMKLRIKNIPFEVIGVLEPKGANLFGQDQDNVVLAPYHHDQEAAQRLDLQQHRRDLRFRPLGQPHGTTPRTK